MLFRYCWDVKYTAAFGINILHIAQHIFHNPDDKFNNVFDMWYYNTPRNHRQPTTVSTFKFHRSKRRRGNLYSN